MAQPPRRPYKPSNFKQRATVVADNSGALEPEDGYLNLEGKVLRVEPSSRFKVLIEVNGKEMLIDAYTAGKLKMNKIRIIQNDIVVVAVSVTDLTKGRIIHRKDYKSSNNSSSSSQANNPDAKA